jgi:four helix bundle protein
MKIREHTDLEVYKKAFDAAMLIFHASKVSKLSDAESEASETQVWLQFATSCEYIERDRSGTLYQTYDEILRMLVSMINKPQAWVISR